MKQNPTRISKVNGWRTAPAASGLAERGFAPLSRCCPTLKEWELEVLRGPLGSLLSEELENVRYLLSARVRPEKRAELLEALESGRFGDGFPYGDLGEVLGQGRVDASGTIRWVEVCYCREYYGVAMEEELPYFEEFLTDIRIADARNPAHCEGYPVCHDCDCTKKVRFQGETLREYLQRPAGEIRELSCPTEGKSVLWLGWRGRVTPEEERRNQATCRNTDGRPLDRGGAIT